MAELVLGLRDELAVLREMNPVMAEMLRHREVLAGATDAERQAVRALIEARLEEEDITRCSCSTSLVIWSAAPCARQCAQRRWMGSGPEACHGALR